MFKAVSNVGRRVGNEARRRCPVDTGRLRASTRSRTTVQGWTVVARISSLEHYGIYVHEGTRYMRARPYLVSALKAMSPWPVNEH